MVTSWQNTYRLTLFSLLFGLLVVGVGAYTRLADAGLGCPDWPGCYGSIIVPQGSAAIAAAEANFPDAPVEAEKAWWEMIHRYLASTLGLLIVAVCVSAWRHRRAGIPWKLPVALVVLVICQGAFGAWTVTLKLWPQVVTAHLGMSLASFDNMRLLRCYWWCYKWRWGGGHLPTMPLWPATTSQAAKRVRPGRPWTLPRGSTSPRR